MYTLDKLWRGEISPLERTVRHGSKYQRASQKVCDSVETFLATQTPEARKQLETIGDLKSDIQLMENEDFFLYGFRLGAGMILDIQRILCEHIYCIIVKWVQCADFLYCMIVSVDGNETSIHQNLLY